MADDKVAIWNQTPKLGRAPANGELLIGDGNGFELATLTAGAGASITNTAGGIEISATGSGGTITDVTATSPLSSSGGTTPDISLSGTVSVSNGGTGVSTLTAENVILGDGTNPVKFVAPGASGNLLTSNGSAWVSSAPQSQWTRIWKTTNQSRTSSVTLTDDSQLSFTAAANKTYSIVFSIIHASGGGGSVFAINGPTSPTALAFGIDGQAGTLSYNTSGGAWNANFTISFRATATITTGANSGTVVLRYAQSSANATSLTVYAGSWLEWAEVS